MKTVKWIVITMILMVIAYAVIHAVLVFAWMLQIGVMAMAVVAIVMLYFKGKKWLKGGNQK